MRKNPVLALAVVIVTLIAVEAVAQQQQAAATPQSSPAPVSQGQQLVRAGKLDEALVFYQGELRTAHNGAGVVLDLLGRTAEARVHFSKAIEVAATPLAKASAQRAMAMSYAFDNDCANTAKYAEMAFETWGAVPDRFRQGEALNEAARVCIEAGDFDAAETLYLRGQKAGLEEPDIAPDRVALWKFRTEHALARLAARRNQPELARKHVAAARATLDANPGMAKDQEVFFPYLAGYVAFYAGEARTALTELAKANQNDPFIQVLMAQAHEKLGEKDQAKALYQKAAATTAHNPPAAFARPFAMKKLATR
jgi:tetratricopeptide (TPR) repeat protein